MESPGSMDRLGLGFGDIELGDSGILPVMSQHGLWSQAAGHRHLCCVLDAVSALCAFISEEGPWGTHIRRYLGV